MRKIKIGMKVKLIRPVLSMPAGARGTVIGYNPYHEDSFNVMFNNGVTVNNVCDYEVEFPFEPVKVIFT